MFEKLNVQIRSCRNSRVNNVTLESFNLHRERVDVGNVALKPELVVAPRNLPGLTGSGGAFCFTFGILLITLDESLALG